MKLSGIRYQGGCANGMTGVVAPDAQVVFFGPHKGPYQVYARTDRRDKSGRVVYQFQPPRSKK